MRRVPSSTRELAGPAVSAADKTLGDGIMAAFPYAAREAGIPVLAGQLAELAP
jgi:hypothetical protein